MTKTFDVSYIPYCTKDFYHYLKPLSTRDELFHLKQYLFYQKNLKIDLINYQNLLISKYYQEKSIRYNYKYYLDKKLFDNFGISPIHSNPNIFIINEKRFNRTLYLSYIKRNNLHYIKKYPIYSQLKSNKSIISINNKESRIKNIKSTIIKLNKCSTLIANGYGPSKVISSSMMNTNNERMNYNTIDEDISLSKTCKNIFNRSLFQRYINSKSI